MAHIYNGILLGHKKEETLPFVTTCLSKINQMEKDFTHMCNIKEDPTNKTNRFRQESGGYQRGRGVGRRQRR